MGWFSCLIQSLFYPKGFDAMAIPTENKMPQTVIRVRSGDGQKTGTGTKVFVEVEGKEYEIAGTRHIDIHPIGPNELLAATFTAAIRIG